MADEVVSESKGVSRPGAKPAAVLGPFATVTLLFFYWGFITVMNDVLIPFLKESFALSYFQAGLVQFAFFGAFFVVSLIYFLASVSGGDPINRIGYQRAIVGALVLCAAGCALFTPAAGAASYAFILGALFLVATGVTILQIAANPYAAVLGKPENAATRLNLAQGFNSLGTTLAPLVGSLLLYQVFTREGELTLNAIGSTYLIYGGICLVLALVVATSRLPAIVSDPSEGRTSAGGALAFPQLRYGMAAIFLYVGAEVAIGSYLINFMADASVMGWAEDVASLYLAYYWGGAMIGRLCGAIAMTSDVPASKKSALMVVTAVCLVGLLYAVTAVKPEGRLPVVEALPFVGMVVLCLAAFAAGRGKPAPVLAVFSATLVALLLVAAGGSGRVALWAALGAGLFNSIMWSNIFTLSIDGLGEHTTQGSSLLVMMIVGGALFPLVMGLVADAAGIRAAFYVPILSYAYVGWFGWWNTRRLASEGPAG
ncbi:MAG: sugar MFS transporter [Planctomycetota bacterium]